MNWFGGRIARDEIHSSIQRWFVRVFCVTILLAPALTHSNPYLAKPGEAPVSVYVSTCAVTGGFIHLYTALDQKIFEKYGIHVKHVVIRGGTNVNLAALGTDEVQFLYCAADSTIPGMATGRDATLIASPLVGLPYLIIARKEIKTVQDLRGKTIGVGTVAGLPYQLLKAFVKKFSLEDMQIRPLGGANRSGITHWFKELSTPLLRRPWTPVARKTVSISFIISMIWVFPPSTALCTPTPRPFESDV